MPYTDNADPNRANLLNDIVEPKLMKSSTDIDEPSLGQP
jgi:hypothetical protein